VRIDRVFYLKHVEQFDRYGPRGAIIFRKDNITIIFLRIAL